LNPTPTPSAAFLDLLLAAPSFLAPAATIVDFALTSAYLRSLYVLANGNLFNG
jgi:hypothetical protein